MFTKRKKAKIQKKIHRVSAHFFVIFVLLLFHNSQRNFFVQKKKLSIFCKTFCAESLTEKFYDEGTLKPIFFEEPKALKEPLKD